MELPTVEALYHYGSAISVFFVIIIPLTRMRVSAISSKRSMLYNTKFTHSYIFLFGETKYAEGQYYCKQSLFSQSLPPSPLPVGCGLHAAVHKICSMELNYLMEKSALMHDSYFLLLQCFLQLH